MILLHFMYRNQFAESFSAAEVFVLN